MPHIISPHQLQASSPSSPQQGTTNALVHHSRLLCRGKFLFLPLIFHVFFKLPGLGFILQLGPKATLPSSLPPPPTP